MRYDADEALRKTLERAAVLRARSARRRSFALSLGAGGCACALLAMGYAMAARSGAALGEADYGAFLLPSHAGGYILAAVLAFAAGVLVTLLCIRYGKAGREAARPSPDRIAAPGGDRAAPAPDRREEDPEERE